MRATARHQVRAALQGLDHLIPVPWTIEALVERLAAVRGRPINLVPWHFPESAGEVSGLWIPSAKADYIFYDRTATTTRREQIIGHELGHMLLEHTPRLSDTPSALVEAMAPDVSPELARRFLARHGYQVEEEALAEEFGTRLIRLGCTKRPPGAGDDELARLTDALQ